MSDNARGLSRALARIVNDEGWTCDTHEPTAFGECSDCYASQSHLGARLASFVTETLAPAVVTSLAATRADFALAPPPAAPSSPE